jgi:hypothetical protein
MTSRDRAAQTVIDGPATHDAASSKRGSDKLAQARERENGRLSERSSDGLPAELRAELRRLLAAILVADVRAYPTGPQEVDEPTAELPHQSNRRRRSK